MNKEDSSGYFGIIHRLSCPDHTSVFFLLVRLNLDIQVDYHSATTVNVLCPTCADSLFVLRSAAQSNQWDHVKRSQFI